MAAAISNRRATRWWAKAIIVPSYPCALDSLFGCCGYWAASSPGPVAAPSGLSGVTAAGSPHARPQRSPIVLAIRVVDRASLRRRQCPYPCLPLLPAWRRSAPRACAGVQAKPSTGSAVVAFTFFAHASRNRLGALSFGWPPGRASSPEIPPPGSGLTRQRDRRLISIGMLVPRTDPTHAPGVCHQLGARR